jgi:hypothetical protein
MSRYRWRAEVVDAEQYLPDSWPQMQALIGWADQPFAPEGIEVENPDDEPIAVDYGDWVIRDQFGEFLALTESEFRQDCTPVA